MVGIGVAVAIINDVGHILLIQREDFEVWGLPGGEVDFGETLAQAAQREAQEETGLSVELTRFVGVYSMPHLSLGNNHIALFAAAPRSMTLNPQPEEVINIGFFAHDDLPDPLMWWHRQRIQDALAGVGNGLTWSQDVRWPFERGMSRADVYRTRDESGLTRAEFSRRYFGAQGEEKQELPRSDQKFDNTNTL